MITKKLMLTLALVGSSLSIQAAEKNEKYDIALIAIDIRGNTALHHAAIFGNVARVQSLIEQKADVNAEDCWGRTPLDKAKTEEVAAVLRANEGKEGNKY